MRHKNKHYQLDVTDHGLLQLRVGGECVMDRGALHEFLDLSERVAEDDGTGDQQRAVHHHIQLYRTVKVSMEDMPDADGKMIKVLGELQTSTGIEGGMRFSSTFFVDDKPGIRLQVKREYLRGYKWVADDSLCFLSPGGFAKWFMAYTDVGDYQERDDGEQWGKIQEVGSPRLPVKSMTPVRLKASVRDSGYGAITGGDNTSRVVGFAVAMCDATIYGPDGSAPLEEGKGEIRCTRPRPPAETKFDEVEYQWAPGGPRKAGTVETASFLIWPINGCPPWAEMTQHNYWRDR